MAARLERSRGWIIKQALSAWIDQEEERSRLTREALADVDAGRVIDHQAVQPWAENNRGPRIISVFLDVRLISRAPSQRRRTHINFSMIPPHRNSCHRNAL
jgi:predicted transcriptional regulator